jgi:hypothetical protein
VPGRGRRHPTHCHWKFYSVGRWEATEDDQMDGSETFWPAPQFMARHVAALFQRCLTPSHQASTGTVISALSSLAMYWPRCFPSSYLYLYWYEHLIIHCSSCEAGEINRPTLCVCGTSTSNYGALAQALRSTVPAMGAKGPFTGAGSKPKRVFRPFSNVMVDS